MSQGSDSPQRRATRGWVAIALAVGLLAAAVIAGARTALGDGTPDRAAIAWHGCQAGPEDEVGKALDEAGAQCGEMTVPLDYARPDARTITVAVSRIKAADPANRRGVLLINPGGPGVPGLEQVLINQLVPQVAARYDLVGMDPRFIGRSTPLHCRWTTNTFLRSAGPDRRTFTESSAFAEDLAAGCARQNRDLLPYASTRNTARDIDVLRAALGEQKISYLGASYGTYLGAVYLQMFGDRADRVVLDGAVDPTVYGPNLLARSAPAMAAALEHWAGWAAGHADRFHLGATTSSVLSTVDRIARAATHRPLRLGEFQVDAHVLPYLLIAPLADDSEETYAALAGDVRVLAAAAGGEAVVPTPSLTQFLTELFTGSGAATDRAGTPILCADRATSRDPGSYLRDIEEHRADEPLFGPLTRNITPCAFWPTEPVEPPTLVRNAVPALIVGSSGDAFAPLPGQQAMHQALTGSRLVTLRGSFRHTVFPLAGSPCIDTAVNHYLLDGVLPETDTTCDQARPGR
ncbi:pimeloyl-ACP methyl ester carboxylesterase [Kibdelosporangium banguiense]|uniref:Pimeloyl-ACP methyl ester carboxylesterase n=1 Tax=Kibdelosporangium banguiense TaxID=1365924 RepID=A0ABS4TXA8_9PSEU|nr:alpha/beta hydrolase [Kibdelosporangium banguiense]MBP2329040.1 pimeloyl-ACP methyl ester carboxylesterase [Kibdelosporangium banguiense]